MALLTAGPRRWASDANRAKGVLTAFLLLAA
jgi:hypothetical protein